MTNLAEIQEAIEKLAPKDRAVFPESLDESDPETDGCRLGTSSVNQSG